MYHVWGEAYGGIFRTYVQKLLSVVWPVQQNGISDTACTDSCIAMQKLSHLADINNNNALAGDKRERTMIRNFEALVGETGRLESLRHQMVCLN